MNSNAENEQKATDPNQSESSSSQKKESEPTIGDFFQNFIKDKNPNLDSTLPGLDTIALYIDARSGGNYFQEQVDITGDIIGRNQKKSIIGSVKKTCVKEVARQVSQRDIEKVSTVYIEQFNYFDAKRSLEENNLIILWGDLHFGKWSTAIYCIFSLLNSENIFEVDPTLKDLTKFQGESNQGYIIDQLAPESASQLNRYSLNRLSKQLKNNKSYLIITVDKTVKLSLTELSPYIIEYNSFPDPKNLLEKHLLWYLDIQDISDRVLELIQNSQIQELIQNKTLLPCDIDRLAFLLSKFLKNELTFDQALASFELIAKQEVELWFDQHLDLSQRTFMISLAVLNKSPYQIVFEASKRLYSIIQPPSDKEQVIVTHTKRSERLKEFSAGLIKDYKNTVSGQTSVDLIVFKNSAFQLAVLEHIWQEYDQYRLQILSWLYELGSHQSNEILSKVALAVGVLCKYDFALVQEQVLLPWANCEDQNLQKLAALALSIPVFDSTLAPQVLNLLHHWSTLDNNPRLRWVATVAYGSYIGRRFPDIALRDLLAIVQSQDRLLFPSVAQSLINIFEMGKNFPDQYLFVLIELQSWTENTKQRIPNILGISIFLLLMNNTKITAESNTTNIPTLLWLAKENNLCQEIITCLVRRALNLKETRQPILHTIRQWLDLVSYDHRLYPTLGEIIYDIIVQGDRNERERIITYLKRWATEKPPNDNAAWKILSVLKKNKNLGII